MLSWNYLSQILSVLKRCFVSVSSLLIPSFAASTHTSLLLAFVLLKWRLLDSNKCVHQLNNANTGQCPDIISPHLPYAHLKHYHTFTKWLSGGRLLSLTFHIQYYTQQNSIRKIPRVFPLTQPPRVFCLSVCFWHCLQSLTF